MRSRWGIAVTVVLAAVLSACAPEPAAGPDAATADSAATPTQTETDTAGSIPTISPSTSPGASPSATAPEPPATIPTDCEGMLSASVLAELNGFPLNHSEVVNRVNPLPAGSLLCIWQDPQADTTGLITRITKMSRGPALDLLNGLADDEGFTCYTPDGGTRCENTWQNEMYPVTDGRTLFWRNDVLIDTRYSNLAPAGYTNAIVASIFG